MAVARFGFLLIGLALAFAPLLAHVRISTKVTWDREIAPIVQARCVSCHHQGGKGPMPLETYEQARPWAKAIKEEVLARRMPKWHVVRGYGDFSNDPSLSAFEVALIASWVDGGSPRLTSGQAPKTLPGTKPADARDASPATRAVKAVKTRMVSTPCSAGLLPAGRLLAIKPLLDKGTSLRLDLARGGGSDEPLIWLKDFDPAFAETYWLRTPENVARGTRLVADRPACTVVLTYAE